MAGISSANPGQLEAAAQAVPEELSVQLASGEEALLEKINRFNAAPQSPERLKVSRNRHSEDLSRALQVGTGIDTFLLRVATAFRIAGGDRPDPNVVGPVVPSPLRYLDDGSLGAQLAAWNTPTKLQFRPTNGGQHEVLGPDGNWYRVLPFVRSHARLLGQSGVQTVDFGNPDYGLALSAGMLSQGAMAPMFRPAPPSAYDSLNLTEDGFPVVGTVDAGASTGPRGIAPAQQPGYVPPSATRVNMVNDAAGVVQGALAGGAQYADFQYMGVHRMQASYYIDSEAGQRVAVVDAARIAYDNRQQEALVNWGRAGFDERGLPTLSPRYDPDDCRPAPRTGTSFEVPVKGGN